jgi:hypothetical protein
MIIENNLIYFPKIDLDIEKIKEIVFEYQFFSNKSLDASHHRTVSDHPYLQEIQSRYSFLSGTYNIYTLPGHRNIPLHVDSRRSAAFNIPIKNTENSETIFYEYNEIPNLEYDSKNIFHRIKSEVKEIFRFTLTEPTLINNSVPHMVVNNSPEPRIILSWSIIKELQFKDIRDKF